MFYNIENSHMFEKYLPASKSIPLSGSIQVNIKILFLGTDLINNLFLDGTG